LTEFVTKWKGRDKSELREERLRRASRKAVEEGIKVRVREQDS